MAVSFDCFETLVTADRSDEPWAAVADALRERAVPVPDDWEAAYRSSHRSYERGAAAPLDEHVRLALASRDVDVAESTVRDAVLEAFDASVSVRDGAREALNAARERGPVAVCSNCSVPGLVERTMARPGLEADAVVTSVGCGWRKPDRRMFDATADALEIPFADLVHVGDDARTDGGAERAGATTVLVDDASLPALAERLRAGEFP